MASNDALFPERLPKPDVREMRTCRECNKTLRLESFPLQTQRGEQRGLRMQVCTYCRNAGKAPTAIDWYAIPLREEYYQDAPPPSLKDRLLARAAQRAVGVPQEVPQ